MGYVCWGVRPEKEEWLEELGGDQNPGSKAPSRSKIGRERREQRKCQGRSDCQKSDRRVGMSESLREGDQMS